MRYALAPRADHSERSSPGSAAFVWNVSVRTVHHLSARGGGASDHARARSGVSIPARTSIPMVGRQPSNRWQRPAAEAGAAAEDSSAAAGGGRRAAATARQYAVCAQTSKEELAYIDGD